MFKADSILKVMDVASVIYGGGARRAGTLILLFLATMGIAPAKWIKFVYDVLIEDCNQQPCGDGL